jgi:serine protease
MRLTIKNLLPLFCCAALAVTAACTKEAADQEENTSGTGPIIINEGGGVAVRGELLLKVKRSSSTRAAGEVSDAKAGADEVARMMEGTPSFRLERLFPECGKFEARTRAEGLDCWYIASFDPSLKSSDIVSQLRRSGSLECIEYSVKPTLADDSEVFSASSIFGNYGAVAAPAGIAAASVSRKGQFPFDESDDARQRQWHYNNTGSVFGNTSLVGADAGVWDAWPMSTGNSDVIVAIIDQGVKFDHEDLADNMWVNPGEIPGNGIDDDGNGYIDDVYGYNFIDGNGTITTSATLSHGTHVAGTIAAVNNNGKGVNGIAGGSGRGDGVRIMTLQSLGDSDSGSSGAGLGGTVRAMKYAADNGAVICQNSWGYTSKVSWNTWTRNTYGALRRAMDYFIKYAGVDENGEQSGPMKGGLIIFAAGNEAVDYPSYPAADDAVVSVAAHSYKGDGAVYTNYGSWIDISAPGGDTYVDSQYGGVYSTIVGEDGGSSYGYMQGTSMACPHVSGACALAVSYYYGNSKRKGLTPDLLKAALLSSAAPFRGSLSETYSGKMGAGMLDTAELLHYMDFLGDIPACSISVGETVKIDLSDYFPTVNVVSCSVSSDGIVETTLDGGILSVTGLSKGEATITLSNGGKLYKELKVTVSK